MLHQFTNNATSALTASITSTDAVITLTSGTGSKFAEIASDNGLTQRLTLTNSTTPNAIEIIEVFERVTGSDSLTVVRGVEGTTALAWPVGTVASARVTAGMLGSFVQSNGAEQIAPNSVAIGKGARTVSSNTWVISGNPVVHKDHPRLPFNPRDTTGPLKFQGFGVEAVIISHIVDIGTPEVWSANKSVNLETIFSSANGTPLQYRAFYDEVEHPVTPKTGSVAPVFPVFAGEVIADGEVSLVSQNAAYIEISGYGGIIFATEVGFICKMVTGVVLSNPVITIKDEQSSVMVDNHTLPVNGDGLPRMFRFPSSSLVSGSFDKIIAKVITPAVGASIVGNFYMRCVIVEM